MRVLIIGNGGREAAFGKKLAKDGRVTEMFFAKGNAATEKLGTNIYITEISELLHFAKREAIDLTIVGPEAPLVEGIVDEFKKAGLRIFGPEKKIANLEGSKAYAKKFMQEFGVKTARSQVFNSFVDAKAYLQNEKFPLVIKASGLAQGKGVVIAEDFDEALKTIHDFMISRIYGDAGIQVVIEDYLKGFEVSIIAFCNGKDIFPMISAKDYKKVGNAGIGANTGGMGSIAPSPDFTQIHNQDFEENIMKPTLAGLKDNYLMFTGFIFFGLLVTENGCHLLEYNMRAGDPETQVLMELLENDLMEVMEDCLDGKNIDLRFKDKKAVCLVLASGGYPGHYETGYEITGLEKVQTSDVSLSGATNKAGRYFTNGGRVLNIIATGDTFDDARSKVYADALSVKFDYAFYRNDIAKF